MVTFSGGMDIISRSLCHEYLFTKEAPQVSFRLNHIRNRCRVVNLLPLLFLILWMMGSVSSHGAPDQVTLQLKWKHQFQFSGYYAAIEQGFYRDAGLEVTLLEAPEKADPAEVVLAGGAEFGIAASDLVLFRRRGAPVVVLAPIFQHSPFIFLVRADSGIDNIHNLAGKKVMLEPHAAELLAYLEFEGLTSREIDIVPHSFSPEPLIEGQVDAMSAYSTDEPFLLKQAGVQYHTFLPRSAGIDFYGDTLFTTEEQIKKHPERVKKFLEASKKGWDYALGHPEEMIELILEKYSRRHSREHLEFEARQTTSLILPDVVEIGYINPGRWRAIANTYTWIGMMEPGFSLEGFLYQHEGRVELRFFYASLAIALAGFIILAALALWYYRMNRIVRQQAQVLQNAVEEIQTLQGMIPVCSKCKKIKDEDGAWNRLEKYFSERSNITFSHKVCEECARELHPDAPEFEKEEK
jgi:ABC-type nitrate/sulfonate/bicarbonate transport system substrate-binding protein